MSSDSEPEIIKEEKCSTKSDTTSKPVSKRGCTPEQLERLAKMREKALEARRAKSEARKAEARKRLEEKEEKRIAKEVAKVKAKKGPTVTKVDNSSDSDGGSPPAAVAKSKPSIDVEPKQKRRRKPVKVAVEQSDSDSDCEIVIRRPSRKNKARKAASVPEGDDEPVMVDKPKKRVYTEEEVNEMFDAKLASFKKSQDDDEVMRLVRHMLPNYGR